MKYHQVHLELWRWENSNLTYA